MAVSIVYSTRRLREGTGLYWQDAYDKWCGDGSNNRHKTAHNTREGKEAAKCASSTQGLEGVARDKKHKRVT